jgi:hypothetical protein
LRGHLRIYLNSHGDWFIFYFGWGNWNFLFIEYFFLNVIIMIFC